ncbi:hypothetical protein J132_07979 [Termitomyces sp. J132]|nr:hypothetical protein J132_07979 [Termitomyces sp. J132]
MRTLVSYDDITLPYQTSPPQSPLHKPPPVKKRKWNNKNSKGRNHNDTRSTDSHQKHTNDIGQVSSSFKMTIDTEFEEGRDLTHDEIWDDSALIDAWDAATEEYEAYHGPDQGWKKEAIHKSPLWYNTPKAKDSHASSNGKISIPAVPESDEQENSQPLDFDTFMPSHNPALDVFGPENAPEFLLGASRPIVSQDEAFTRALGAMYWCGYWTAMYHAQRQSDRKQSTEDEVQQGEEDSIDEDGGAEEEEEEENVFVSTQR